MNTLILVPLNNAWINPEEIAAIEPDSFDLGKTVIRLRSNQQAIVIKDMTPDQVVERLQKHFAPVTKAEQQVLDATNILKYAAKSFPDDCDPIRLAAGIEDIHKLLAASKSEES